MNLISKVFKVAVWIIRTEIVEPLVDDLVSRRKPVLARHFREKCMVAAFGIRRAWTYINNFILARQDTHWNCYLLCIFCIEQRRVALCRSLEDRAFLADKRRYLAAPTESQNRPRVDLWVLSADVFQNRGNKGNCP